MTAGNNLKASDIWPKLLATGYLRGAEEPKKRKEAGHYSGLFTTTLKF
jgi:hypothetical protein